MDGATIENRPARTLLKPVLPETALFAMICTVDMVVTIVLIATGLAVEANPLLAKTLAYGIGAFTAVKTFSFVVPLAIAEALRPQSPIFIRRVLQLGVCGYLLVYVVASVSINPDLVGSLTGALKIFP